MTVNVYTKEEKIKYVELNVDVEEYFTILKALCTYAGNPDMPLEDRRLAVSISDDMNKKNKIELDEFN